MQGLKNRTGVVFFTAVSVFVLNLLSVYEITQAQHRNDNNIRIGLMLSGSPESDPQSQEVLFTAQYLIDQINEDGGIDGRKIEIIFKSGDGDWGISSKRSVELIFDHEVSAIIGSLDGQNAHLTQMAITKAEVVYLATRSTDPTLSEINIPWFFRIIPNDQQQADLLIDDIFVKRGLNRVIVIYSDRYDHKMAARTFIRLASETHQYSVQSFEFQHNHHHLNHLISSLNKDEPGGIVFFGTALDLQILLSEIEKHKWQKPIYLSMTDLNDIKPVQNTLDINFICTQNWPITFEPSFLKSFQVKFQRDPGFNAAFMYDGLRVLIDRIHASDNDRRIIRDMLAATSLFQGTTGDISFKTNGDIHNYAKICRL